MQIQFNVNMVHPQSFLYGSSMVGCSQSLVCFNSALRLLKILEFENHTSLEIYHKLDGSVFGEISLEHSNTACNIQLMVHYHQQALQLITFVDISKVFCKAIAILNPVCKNTYDVIH